MSKTRILFVEANEDDTVGGSHQALYDLVQGLLFIGERQPVVVFYRDNQFAEDLRQIGVDTHVLRSIRRREREAFQSGGWGRRRLEVLAAIGRRWRFLHDKGIDLVHLNNSPFVGFDDWLPAAKLEGIPCVTNAMGGIEPPPPRNPVKRLLFRSFDRVLPVSELVATALREKGIPEERIRIVRHGVDIDELYERVRREPLEVRRQLGVPADKVLIAMVANVRRWKGQHVVLEALGQLGPTHLARTHTIFAGAAGSEDQEYVQRLKQLVDEEGLDEHVDFLGYRDDVPDLLNASDIAVHASVHPEPGGIAVMEAMALGTPVIAAETGGHAEIVTPDAGLLFDTSEPGQLTAHLEELLDAPERRRAMGSNAAEAMEHYDIVRNVRSVRRIYEELLVES